MTRKRKETKTYNLSCPDSKEGGVFSYFKVCVWFENMEIGKGEPGQQDFIRARKEALGNKDTPTVNKIDDYLIFKPISDEPRRLRRKTKPYALFSIINQKGVRESLNSELKCKI